MNSTGCTADERARLVHQILEVWAQRRGVGQESPDALAKQAVDAVLAPETWTQGDLIPNEVNQVEDPDGYVWGRVRDSLDICTGWWHLRRAPHLTEAELLETRGPVRREARPVQDQAPPEPTRQNYLRVIEDLERVLTQARLALVAVMDAREGRKTITAPLYRKVRDAADTAATAATAVHDLTDQAGRG